MKHHASKTEKYANTVLPQCLKRERARNSKIMKINNIFNRLL